VGTRQGGQGRKVDKEEKNCIAQDVFKEKDCRGNKPFKEIPLPQSKSAIMLIKPCKKQEIVLRLFPQLRFRIYERISLMLLVELF